MSENFWALLCNVCWPSPPSSSLLESRFLLLKLQICTPFSLLAFLIFFLQQMVIIPMAGSGCSWDGFPDALTVPWKLPLASLRGEYAAYYHLLFMNLKVLLGLYFLLLCAFPLPLSGSFLYLCVTALFWLLMCKHNCNGLITEPLFIPLKKKSNTIEEINLVIENSCFEI